MKFSIPLVLKVVELVICLVCIGINDYSYVHDKIISILTATVFVGYAIIVAGLLLAKVLNRPVARFVDMFYMMIGAVLSLTVGSLLIIRYKDLPIIFGLAKGYKDANLAKGSLSVINGVIMVVDVVLTFNKDT